MKHWKPADVVINLVHVPGCLCQERVEGGRIRGSSLVDTRCITGYATPDDSNGADR